MAVVFESKRDTWIIALIWAGSLVCAYTAFGQLTSAGPFAARAVAAVALTLTAVFMLWLLYGTDYVLGKKDLLVRCGPFRYRIPLKEIDTVEPSRNPLSSPACSLDRLLVTWDARRRILISPSRREAFLRELGTRCPQLQRRGESYLREPR